MGIATVRGGFKDFEGTLEISDVPSATARGTVKAASVDTTEAQRDAHLRSPDFFDAETYPELAFEIDQHRGDRRRHSASPATARCMASRTRSCSRP
jgi:polyisoprenoid-binding protein YceI